VQLGPNARDGLEGEPPHRFTAVAERQDEQARAPVFARLRVAHPRTGAVVDLGLLTLTMVNIALGNADLSACTAGDANHDGQITVDEVLTAVNNA
jgi:hypothetical protein